VFEHYDLAMCITLAHCLSLAFLGVRNTPVRGHEGRSGDMQLIDLAEVITVDAEGDRQWKFFTV